MLYSVGFARSPRSFIIVEMTDSGSVIIACTFFVVTDSTYLTLNRIPYVNQMTGIIRTPVFKQFRIVLISLIIINTGRSIRFYSQICRTKICFKNQICLFYNKRNEILNCSHPISTRDFRLLRIFYRTCATYKEIPFFKLCLATKFSQIISLQKYRSRLVLFLIACLHCILQAIKSIISSCSLVICRLTIPTILYRRDRCRISGKIIRRGFNVVTILRPINTIIIRRTISRNHSISGKTADFGFIWKVPPDSTSLPY